MHKQDYRQSYSMLAMAYLELQAPQPCSCMLRMEPQPPNRSLEAP